MSTTNPNEELELLRRFFDESEKITDPEKKKDVLDKCHDLFTKIIERDCVKVREDGKCTRQEKALNAKRDKQEKALDAERERQIKATRTRENLYKAIGSCILLLPFLHLSFTVQSFYLRLLLSSILALPIIIFVFSYVCQLSDQIKQTNQSKKDDEPKKDDELKKDDEPKKDDE